MIRSFFIVPLIFISCISIASTLYHCPNIEDIKYNRGYFNVNTNYNGLQMDWFPYSDGLPYKKIELDFIRVIWSSGIGGLGDIACIYQVNNKEYVGFSLLFYVSPEVDKGPWVGNDMELECKASTTSSCSFYVESI